MIESNFKSLRFYCHDFLYHCGFQVESTDYFNYELITVWGKIRI